jgi:DNA modification methylase
MSRQLGEEPFYSAGPNGDLAGFIETFGNPAAPIEGELPNSIAAGKNTYVYDTHTYHTKVPPAGIAAFIEAFTRRGDIVLDPFAGSGMTGVAARTVGRHAILSDLSPAATFISYNFLRDMDVDEWDDVCTRFMAKFHRLEMALYKTFCRACGQNHPTIYTVWSYRVQCPACAETFNYWEVGRSIGASVRESRLRTEVNCPHCQVLSRKKNLKRLQFEPVEIGYKCAQRRSQQETMAQPSAEDCDLIARIESRGVPNRLWYPTDKLPDGVNTRQPVPYGIASVDAFYTTRNLWAMAALWREATRWPDRVQGQRLMFALTGLYLRVTKFSEFRFWGGSGNSPRLYVPMVMNEQNVFVTLRRKLRHIRDHLSSAQFDSSSQFCITTQSSGSLEQVPDHSVDYIFTDPPFGANINYSEMNFLWESWLGVYTETGEEAIVNSVQGKGLAEYEDLLTSVFRECMRVLKPGGSMTVVFNNSSQRVWHCLARSVERAGFGVQASLTFDKRHPTLKQLTAPNVAGLDVAIHCTAKGAQGDSVEASTDQLAEVVRTWLATHIEVPSVIRTPRFLYGQATAALLDQGLLPPMNFPQFRDWVVQAFAEGVDPEPVPRYLRELSERRGVTSPSQLELAPRDGRLEFS